VRPTTQNRLFAFLGIGSVVLELGAVVIGAIGGRQFATISSGPSQMRDAVAKQVTTTDWVGAYLEVIAFGMFLAFAIWACMRLGGGLLGAIATAAATGYTTLSIASLGVGDAIAYRSGHPMGIGLVSFLFTLNEALYVGTWFLAVFFLLAAGPAAILAGRTVLGWSGIGVAAVILVTTAASLDNLGQMSNFLWLLWIIGASISLAREQPAQAPAASVALA
jgi:hypothetical protein